MIRLASQESISSARTLPLEDRAAASTTSYSPASEPDEQEHRQTADNSLAVSAILPAVNRLLMSRPACTRCGLSAELSLS